VAVSSGEGDQAPTHHRLDLARQPAGELRLASDARHPGPWLSTARDYIDRKRAEHKTKREARRAHKRHLANVIRRMWADHARRHATVAEPLTAAAA
jgi:transposase